MNDVVRMGRFLRRGTEVVVHENTLGVPTTREDVIMVLSELRTMLNRMFNRLDGRVLLVLGYPSSRFSCKIKLYFHKNIFYK